MLEEIFSGSVFTVIAILLIAAVYLAGRKALGDLLPQLRAGPAEQRKD